MVNVEWQKCTSGSWCRLNSELLDDPRLNPDDSGIRIWFNGVYIIWAGTGDDRTILKVGSGFIKDRLRAHLNDPKVQVYKNKGLYVTWTFFLPLNQMEGIERFLGLRLNPILADRFPDVEMIAVNLPEWAEPLSPLLRGVIQR